MAADEKSLGELHTAVATMLTEALKGQVLPGYTDENDVEQPGGFIPPSAAIIQAATKFLKDNNITCTPSKDNALGALEDQIKRNREKRAMDRQDRLAATEQTSFMSGLPN